jgi:mono/diheme cytochrome c family protein
LRFTSEQQNIAPSDLELIGQGDGTFSARGTYLSIPGTWQVQAVVRREAKFDAYANFNFTLRKPGTPGENAANVSKQTGVLILFSGLLCGLLAFAVEGKPAFRLGVGVPLTVLTIGLGVYYFSRPAPGGIEQANPVPPNTESVAAGRALFMENCALCHGDTGKGDGILGLTLNPRPADLTQHAIAGIHTDAQLFEWISNGFPGSSMPPFKASLSDTDRWHLVNFIRSLAPK